MPFFDPAAFPEGKVQMGVEGFQNLGKGQSPSEMPYCGQRDPMMANAGVRQGRFHLGLNEFSAVRAIRPMQDIFRHFRLDGGGNIFHDSGADVRFPLARL